MNLQYDLAVGVITLTDDCSTICPQCKQLADSHTTECLVHRSIQFRQSDDTMKEFKGMKVHDIFAIVKPNKKAVHLYAKLNMIDETPNGVYFHYTEVCNPDMTPTKQMKDFTCHSDHARPIDKTLIQTQLNNALILLECQS